MISLDIPSGLCGDTGQILGCAIKADHTFPLVWANRDFILGRGPGLTGQVKVISIGFPKELLNEVCNKYFLVEKGSIPLPVYGDEANKSDRDTP